MKRDRAAFSGGMVVKLYYSAIVLITLLICGCASQKQTPAAVVVNQPQLQGERLSEDKHAAMAVYYHMLDVPECRDYMDEVLAEIGKRTEHLDYSRYPSATFDLRLEIYRDGTVGNVSVYGATNVPAAYADAIRNGPPFPKWPDRMRAVVGGPRWIMYIDSGFNLAPPLPN